MTIKYFVTLTEYERGWGSRIDSVQEFNAANDGEDVPDWYMVASYPQMREV